MAGTIDVYLEATSRRTFACAVDWPGWCRGGKTEGQALEALARYAPRYARAIGRTAGGLKMARSGPSFRVAERVGGNASTDFGIPGRAPRLDERPLTAARAKRLLALLRAAWRTFDRVAADAKGARLSTGPRGGGRSLAAIVEHVHDADGAYLSKIGGPTKPPSDEAELRSLFLGILTGRARGEPPPRMPRSGGVWPVPYAVRRSAWHALDHAWEIEDRSSGP
jgi:hypothetical protein